MSIHSGQPFMFDVESAILQISENPENSGERCIGLTVAIADKNGVPLMEWKADILKGGTWCVQLGRVQVPMKMTGA